MKSNAKLMSLFVVLDKTSVKTVSNDVRTLNVCKNLMLLYYVVMRFILEVSLADV